MKKLLKGILIILMVIMFTTTTSTESQCSNCGVSFKVCTKLCDAKYSDPQLYAKCISKCRTNFCY